MTLSVPGMPPLTVGVTTSAGWGGDSHGWASAADWLTLVEKCGLTPHLEDTAK
jgi:hypothetical protein